MGQAFVRIFFIFFCCVFLAGTLIYGINRMAPDQYPTFEHPLRSGKPWVINYVYDSNSEFPEIDSNANEVIYGAQLQELSDESLVLWPEHLIQSNGKVQFLKQMDPKAWSESKNSMSFDEFLQKYSDKPIYIEINHPQVFNIQAFMDKIKASRSDNRVLIQTSSQSLKKNLKEKEPRWLYGANTAEAGKFKLFSALYMAPILTAIYDFIVLDSYTDVQIEELKKRHITPLVKSEKSLVSAKSSL